MARAKLRLLAAGEALALLFAKPAVEETEDEAADSASRTDAEENSGAPVAEPDGDELAAWIAAIPLAYMVPFLMGFENIIGILIIGFALWQAFRMNARMKIELQGPFRLEARDPALG